MIEKLGTTFSKRLKMFYDHLTSFKVKKKKEFMGIMKDPQGTITPFFHIFVLPVNHLSIDTYDLCEDYL